MEKCEFEKNLKFKENLDSDFTLHSMEHLVLLLLEQKRNYVVEIVNKIMELFEEKCVPKSVSTSCQFHREFFVMEDCAVALAKNFLYLMWELLKEPYRLTLVPVLMMEEDGNNRLHEILLEVEFDLFIFDCFYFSKTNFPERVMNMNLIMRNMNAEISPKYSKT